MTAQQTWRATQTHTELPSTSASFQQDRPWQAVTPQGQPTHPLRSADDPDDPTARHRLILSEPFLTPLMAEIPRLGRISNPGRRYPRPPGYMPPNGRPTHDWRLAAWQISTGNLPFPQSSFPDDFDKLRAHMYADLDIVTGIDSGPHMKAGHHIYRVKWNPYITLTSLHRHLHALLGLTAPPAFDTVVYLRTPFGDWAELGLTEWPITDAKKDVISRDFPDIEAAYQPDRTAAPPPQGRDCHLTNAERQGFWPPPPPTHQQTTPTTVATLINKQCTLDVQACNPDTDIDTPPGNNTKHCIQLGLRQSWTLPAPEPTDATPMYVYHPDGRCAGRISQSRFLSLKYRFRAAVTADPGLLHRYNLSSDWRKAFPPALAALLTRYQPSRQTGKKLITERSERRLPPALRWALFTCFGSPTATDRLSSPLNVSIHAPTYFTPFPEDALFGANHDAFTVPFHGLSVVHPEDNPDLLRQALSWAVLSLQSPPAAPPDPAPTPGPDSPTLPPNVTLMVVPGYQDNVYQPHVDSQTVHLAAQVTYWPCTPPDGTPPGPDTYAIAKPERYTILAITDTPGSEHYRTVILPELQARLLQSNGPCYRVEATFPAPQHPRTPTGAHKASCWAQRHMHEVLHKPLPAHTSGPVSTSDQPHLPTSHTRALQGAKSGYKATIPLRFRPQDSLYTDGSRRGDARAPRLGAAVWDGSTQKTLHVEPNGLDYTNTITRAELAAILAALDLLRQRDQPQPAAHIFTDSAASIYLIRKYINSPALLRLSKHRALLADIVACLHSRASAGLTTNIRKVPAHVGIAGNEKADAGAVAVAEGKVTPTFTCQSDNEPFRRLWWVGRTDTHRAASDLNQGILHLLPEDTHTGFSTHTL